MRSAFKVISLKGQKYWARFLRISLGSCCCLVSEQTLLAPIRCCCPKHPICWGCRWLSFLSRCVLWLILCVRSVNLLLYFFDAFHLLVSANFLLIASHNAGLTNLLFCILLSLNFIDALRSLVQNHLYLHFSLSIVLLFCRLLCRHLRDVGHLLNRVLCCSLLLNLFLSFVALIDHFSSRRAIVWDRKPAWEWISISEESWYRVFCPVFLEIFRDFSCLYLLSLLFIVFRIVFHPENVLNSCVCALLQDLLLYLEMVLWRDQTQLIFVTCLFFV